MSKTILLLLFLLVGCITDEKTACYSEGQEISQRGFILANCEANIFATTVTRFAFPDTKIGQAENDLTKAMILGCLIDYSVYKKCKNKSQIKPVTGTGEGIE